MGEDGPGLRTGEAGLRVSVPMHHQRSAVGSSPVLDVHRLIWSTGDAVSVEVAGRPLVVGKRTGAWVPAGTRIDAADDSALGQACFDPAVWPALTAPLGSVALDDLLVATLASYVERSSDSVVRAMADVLVDGVRRALAGRCDLPPFPSDPAARRVAEAIMSDPSDRRGLDAWARQEATSERTLRRRFINETGLTFTRWSSAIRLQHARALLGQGQPMSIAANRSGYRTARALRQALRLDGWQPAVSPSGGSAGPPGDAVLDEGRRTDPAQAISGRRRRTRVFVDALGRTVSVPNLPTRVAALQQFTIGEPLLALGAPVVAMTAEGPESTWHPPLAQCHDLSHVDDIGPFGVTDLDALRDLEPDLIVAYSFLGEPQPGVDVEQLQRIAPTVVFDEAHPRSDSLTAMAALVNRSGELELQRQRYHRALTALSEELPGAARVCVYASVVIVDSAMSLHSCINPNPITRVLRNLRLQTPRITEQPALYVHLDDVCRLRTSDEPDVLLVESRSQDPTTVDRWHELQAVTNDQVFHIETPAGISYRSSLVSLQAIRSTLLDLADAA
ncbi:MAG: helix-turn-helix domain-containing protein [Actinomycetota bacterium]